MNRLTAKYSGIHVCYKNGYKNTVLCSEMTVPQTRECMDKLAAYEDTGLEPEEITIKTLEKQIPKRPTEAFEYFYNLLMDTLEKQIPKKPTEHYNWCDLTTDDFRWYCKNCDNNLDETEKHCPNCGQKIDWEVEE